MLRGLFMKNSRAAKTTSGLLLITMYLSSVIAGQGPVSANLRTTAAESSRIESNRFSKYLVDLAQLADARDYELYQVEADKVLRIASSRDGKSPVIIDESGSERGLVRGAAAYRMAENRAGRRV